ncbi:exopolyphosphatase / guanosine-5'-triphosphate,3'-diphosphate pyrophosphatase [Terribacillus halophilus]|uniref:Exopolyphosphatase n=1 Tax=Terribacillus halophilus TaxID=361279 RepID=A0A1G6IN94_9BACI|nr:exopolyphosphatase [Terribacillus halophilus]SDC07913.1 exopolyphosphatase / guanosine-5'-triphosphate,3'-diphosphate pyrophosphatase [Terribacillus halophilus]
MTTKYYAIIDIGSNTMRLVVYLRDKSGRIKEKENVKVVARLRNYLTAEGILDEEGIQTLIKTLHSFQEVTRYYELESTTCVATATVRHAKNQQEILELVEKETDFTIRILSDYEEAYLGYLAVTNSMPFEHGITIDIGGGSTELTYFKDRKLQFYHSFPFGALSLKRQFVACDKPTAEELEQIHTYVCEQLRTLDWLPDKQLPIIAIGGSARNVVQIHQEEVGYPLAGLHQYKMKKQDIEEMEAALAPLDFAELQKVDGLSKDRADIILPAMQVFLCLLDIVDTTDFVLSRKGLRDGLLYEVLRRRNEMTLFTDVLERSFEELAKDFEIDRTHALKRQRTALQLAELVETGGYAEWTDHDKFLLRYAAFVYNVGAYIDTESGNQHTFYLLANRTIDGLLHKDRIILALLASFKNKSFYNRNAEVFQTWFKGEELAHYRLLGAIIKLANSLHATKRNIVADIKLQENGGDLVLVVTCNKDWQAERYQVEKQKKHLEKQLRRNIQLVFQEDAHSHIS